MNKKIIIFITLFIIVLIPTYKVEAKTLGDLRKELSNLEAKYEENKTICFPNYYADTYNHRPRAMGINYLHRAGRWLDW